MGRLHSVGDRVEFIALTPVGSFVLSPVLATLDAGLDWRTDLLDIPSESSLQTVITPSVLL
jgi:hypothetical protein